MAQYLPTHLKQWKHNRELLGLISKRYHDWAVTLAFYTSLHLVDAVIARDGLGARVSSHRSRFLVLGAENRYQAIRRPFEALYQMSRTVRYEVDWQRQVSADQVQAQVLHRCLYPIERSCCKLLKVEEPEPVVWPPDASA